MRPESLSEDEETGRRVPGVGELDYADASEMTLHHEHEHESRSFSSRAQSYLLSKAPPRAAKFLRWTYGENASLGLPKPWLRITIRGRSYALEPLWIRWTRRFTSPILLGVLIAAYIISISFFARAQWYQTPADDFIQCTSSFWSPNDGCGVNGTACQPFEQSTPVQFRCPAACPSVPLANIRAVGDLEVVYEPLVVGGGDVNGTYRGDSWLCVAAVQQGHVSASRGGCAAIELIGTYKNFEGFKKNGVKSVSFPSSFPLSYRFLPHSGLEHCEDMRDDALGFNVAITFLLTLVLRPKALTLFWCLVCIGFWHITFFSDPRSAPPPISDAIGAFLPALFVCYAFWRSSFRFTLPHFSTLPIERTFWLIGGFWPGVLFNLTTNKIPVGRLTASDINARSGALAAVIIIALCIFVLVLNQIRVIRKTQRLPILLVYYVIGALVCMILALLPDLQFRLHHYFFAIILLPVFGFPTRISLLFQGFLLGTFLNGISRWGFDSILETAAELRRDAPLGSSLPSFASNLTFTPLDLASSALATAASTGLASSLLASLSFLASNTTSQILTWNPIPSDIATSEGWDGFSLIIDDVERYTGPDSGLNYSLVAGNGDVGGNGTGLDWSVQHFFRLSYQKQGSSGDYTRAAVIYPNGTYVPPEPGPS